MIPERLLDKLSLEQKVRLLTGADMWHTHDEPAIGLRAMVLSDGPSGIRGAHVEGRQQAVNLPSATALGATWDPDLARRYGAVLAAEARRLGVDVVLGPTINLHRSPLGGRHFEAFAEDPLLTSRLAAEYVRGVQAGGVGATPKHYVANDFETDRFTANVVVSERALRELYLAAFEDTVRHARPWLVMSAYNSVNGTTMTENSLLAEPLCGEWGFDGVVVSDWWATRSTEPAAAARQDLAMPGPDGPWGDKLVAAVREGRVPESVVDEKVLRLLRLADRVGALDEAASVPATVDGAALAREVAAEGTVLVRNNGELPWTAPASVAVIGQSAVLARSQGGGSAMVEPPYVVSPVDGLRAALPDTEISWTLGALVEESVLPFAPGSLTDPITGEPGVHVVFRGPDGTELAAEHRATANLTRLGAARPDDATVVELTTVYRPEKPGPARLGVATAGQVTVTVDGAEVLAAELVHDGQEFAGGLLSPPVAAAQVTFQTESRVVVRVTMPPKDRHNGSITLTVGTPLDTADVAAAVEAARAADVALVVVGTSADLESEGFDRATLSLPGGQDDLVRAVAAANPRTVVVVNAGAPVLMPWRDDVAAVLLTWFGGQELGHALADVLTGSVEPGGRLPTTWPAAEADVPVLDTTPTDGVVAYEEGVHVGHRAWLRAGVEPAYEFGHGLGYTTWELTDLVATEGEIRLRVHNTGARTGKQVVQVYLSRPDSAIDRPVRWLAGFTAVRLDAGSSREVVVPIAARAFDHWDGGWHTEPGEFTVHVGTSVTELPLTARVAL